MGVSAGESSALEAHLGYWLRFVSNHVSHAFARKLEGESISVSEWVVLRELFDAGRAPAALAERIGMTRGAVSKIVDRLERKGLAERKAVLDDRRALLVRLTRRGRALVPRLCALADANDDEFFGHLAPETRADLVNAMQDLVRFHGFKQIPTE